MLNPTRVYGIPMRYLLERDYFTHQNEFKLSLFDLAFNLAEEFASSFDFYEVLLLGKREMGVLPKDEDELRKLLKTWKQDPRWQDFTDDAQLSFDIRSFEDVTSGDSLPRFWYSRDQRELQIQLSPDGYLRLEAFLKARGLPKGLFYREDEMVCVPWVPKTRIGRVFRRLGFTSQRCLSPREWAREQHSVDRRS